MGPAKTPGMHGTIFPWEPQKVGVGVSVLGKSEQELWWELYQAVANSLEHLHSRYNSLLGSPATLPSEREEVEESYLFQEFQHLHPLIGYPFCSGVS